MAVLLAVFIPVLMLGVVLALGRYEDLVLPTSPPPPPDDPGPAETPAPPRPDPARTPSGRESLPSGHRSRG